MKKITLFLFLMICTLGYSQDPTTVATTPPTRNSSDVISIYSGTYTNITSAIGKDWGQSTNLSDITVSGDLIKKMTEFNYQGIVPATTMNLTSFTKLHIDIYKTSMTSMKVYLINPGPVEVAITLTPTLVGWNSFDIDLNATNFPGINFSDVFQMKLESVPFAFPNGNQTTYFDNLYFWRPEGTPTITGFSVPAKTTNDVSFDLVDPASNSTGTFSYSSSNSAVATISGRTVTIVGAGSSIITATQAASSPYIQGSVSATLNVTAPLPPAAPIPQTNAATVISLYSETYPVTGYLYDFGEATAVDLDPTAAVNNALKINFDVAGYGQGFNQKDISAMQYVHFDYYTTNSETFSLHLISDNPVIEAVYKYDNHTPIVFNTWVGVNIPLSYFTGIAGFSTAKFFQFKFGTASDLSKGHTVYFDNLYLTSSILSIETFESLNVKMHPNPVTDVLNIEALNTVENVAVYNVLGQEVLSLNPNSNSITIDTNSLKSGVYIIKAIVDGKTASSKFIKK
ncbi:T9SS type A sorting domain-containing protein [Flavobacterium sp. NG2]|uniref:T9SS type A sorting domain-containing protein n=1 Tax=Flavobacterium sp. NG2 TaxID=3097547 RepID=UPI002A7EDD63|nr:T9SS type A sorting domain-containing protein [Flavobacterium sp. NG2]WPR71886.1 T9SS type A sorting domain-containing protein [Flavobacterium sp. NG2]